MSAEQAPAPWAEADWVQTQVRRRENLRLGLLFGGLVLGGGLHLAGVVLSSSTSAWLYVSCTGLALLMAMAIYVPFVGAYRRTSESMPSTIFHVSSACWAEGDAVTLEIGHARAKNVVIVERWPRRQRLVYFFPQRPTIKHARGQRYRRRGHVQRYLYELEVEQPVDVVLSRSEAWATTTDIAARVVRRHSVELPRSRRVRSRA